MAVPFDTPVSAIEGIGPAAERLLQVQGVFSIYDLLRTSSPALHACVSAVASLEEVKQWRQMAVLLEVAAITTQWAEALVKGGVTSVGELRRLRLAELTTIFADACTAGTIPAVPTSDQVAAMLSDAALLDYAGAVTGTIRARDGSPVQGAAIAAGGHDAISDERGRFRLRRLLLGRPVRLSLSKQGLQTTTLQVLPLPTATVEVQQFVMLPELAAPPRPSGRTAGALSELNGDVMPAPVAANVTSGEVPVDSLRSGDLLMLTEFYANGKDAKLVSKLLEYDGSRLVVHWVRLPKTELPESSQAGDHFFRRGGAFQKVAMSPAKLAGYKKLLQVRASRPPHPRATSIEDAYVRAAEAFVAMNARQP